MDPYPFAVGPNKGSYSLIESKSECLALIVRGHSRAVHAVRDRVCEPSWHTVILSLAEIFLVFIGEAPQLNKYQSQKLYTVIFGNAKILPCHA